MAKHEKKAAPSSTGKGIKGFQKGKSGNPAGRPKGSRNKTTLMAQALFDDEAENICRKIIEIAVNMEDWPALKACLDRILPPVKSVPIEFDMPAIETVGDLIDGYNAVAKSFASGNMSADEARVFIELLSGMRQVLEVAISTSGYQILK